MKREALRKICLDLQSELASGEFSRLANETRGGFSTAEIEAAIKNYGRKLRVPREQEMICGIVPLSDGLGYSVVAPLWTEEEGRSDLSLEFSVYERESGPEIQIDGIHVL